MCRLLAYKGPPVILDDLLYKPEHSIIKQSYHAQEMDEPLNGDGFGIGWYARHIDSEPAVFASVRPAWNNQNLQYMTPKILSDCVFAHVRAASVGGVNPQNCHPFHCQNYLMMHNGGIDDFQEIRRPLLEKLSDEAFNTIKGQTDSEHIFALFLEHLDNHSGQAGLSDCLDALRAAVDDVIELRHANGQDKGSRLNLLISDGTQFIGSRLALGNQKDPLSLYYAKGARFECRNDQYALQKNGDESDEQAVLFVSERLNNDVEDWQTVPGNHFFTVNSQGAIEFISA